MKRLFRPHQWPLRAQVRVSVCLVIALASMAIGEGIARRNAARTQAEAGASLLQTAHSMADRLSQEMAARVRDVQLLANLDVVRTIDDPAAARVALEQLRTGMPVFAWIGLTDRDGTVVASVDDILLGASIAARPVFKNGSQGLWTGDVHEAVLLAKLVPHPPGEPVKFVDVAAPVHAPDGTFRGVLALHLSWQWADQLRETVLRPRGMTRSQQLIIVNSQGQVLLPSERGNPDNSVQPWRIAALNDRYDTETWTDGKAAVTAVAESRPIDGFSGFGWRVVVRDTAAASPAILSQARLEAHGWALALGLLGSLIACVVIGRLVAPVERLAEALRESDSLPPATRSQVRSQRRNDVQQITAAVTRLQNAVRDRNETVTELTDKADRDPLTGLWNRSRLQATIVALDQSAAFGPTDHCILCIDLDGFKGVNDRYGHAAGDDVLVQVARRLRQAARTNDLVFRLGGDEFLMLLPCERGEAAAVGRAVAGRVLAELQRPLSYRTLSNLRINGSIGGAVWPANADTVSVAVGHADEALYAAKQSGRGQFRQYAGAPEAPRLTA